MPHWFEQWHGVKLPSSAVANLPTGTGGSTAMSTGVTNALSTKAGVGHTHGAADISSLASTLSGLAAAISTKAAGSHTHPQSDVTNLESTITALEAKISTKAAGSHTHAQADVTDLESTLAAIASSLTGLAAQISTKAAGSHVHANADAAAAGFAPQLPANSTTFLRSDLTWASPPGGVGSGPSMVKNANAVTTASSFADVTGLSFAVSSASAYYFEFFLSWNVTVSTNGAKFAVNGPASPTRINYQIDISTGGSGSLVRSAQAYDTCVAITAAASTGTWPAWVGGVLITGANAGTLIARAAPRVTTTNVTVSSGCVGVLYGPF